MAKSTGEGTPAPKRRGRPPGSKNKKPSPTAKRRAAEAEAKAKRGRGRPPKKESRPAAVQTVLAEIVPPGQGFGQKGFRQADREETADSMGLFRGDEQLGQMVLPYALTAGRKKLLALNEATLTRVWVLGACQCSQHEAAARLGVSHKTFQRYLDEHEPARDVWEDSQQVGLGSLRSHLFNEAIGGNTTALIHAAKHWLGMNDKPEAVDHSAVMGEKLNELGSALRTKFMAFLEQKGSDGVPSQSDG